MPQNAIIDRVAVIEWSFQNLLEVAFIPVDWFNY